MREKQGHVKLEARGRARQVTRCLGRTNPTRVDTDHPRTKVVEKIVQVLATAFVASACSPLDADALLNSPNRLIPRSVEAALRRSIPAVNPTVEDIQKKVEKIGFLLRIPQRKPYGAMQTDVELVSKIVRESPQEVLQGIPDDQSSQGERLLSQLSLGLDKLLVAINQKDPDRTSTAVANVLGTVAEIEILQAPGLPYTLPAQYSEYPRLTGRATVRFSVEKAQDGGEFVVAVGGGGRNDAQIEIVVDGYSAPITGGAFVSNVEAGKYNDMELVKNGTAVLGAGPFEDEGSIPLEMKPNDSFEPMYRLPLDVLEGEVPSLPLSLYGAVAMVHSDPESSSTSSSDKFFIYLYDPQQSGLSGLSFEEGQFAVLGYVTGGREVLSQLQTGDRILKAEVVRGKENLLIPPRQESYPELT